jgi:hypothetical protein
MIGSSLDRALSFMSTLALYLVCRKADMLSDGKGVEYRSVHTHVESLEHIIRAPLVKY